MMYSKSPPPHQEPFITTIRLYPASFILDLFIFFSMRISFVLEILFAGILMRKERTSIDCDLFVDMKFNIVKLS